MDAYQRGIDGYDGSVGHARRYEEEAKGLQNRLGEQNCFLNVVIQGLWHLRSFRDRFQNDTSDHNHNDPCIYCAIKVLLTNYRWSEEAVLPPKVLRETLSQLFAKEGRFQVNQMDDAMEALDSILTSLHACLIKKSNREENVCDPICLVHQVFGLYIMEQTECSACHATSEPFFSHSFLHYANTNDLLSYRTVYPQLGLDSLLHLASEPTPRSCSNENCTEKNGTKRYLFPPYPDLFTIGLAWDTPRPSTEALSGLFDLLDEQINLKTIYPNMESEAPYRLKGMICFYAHHYTALFLNPIKRTWSIFDDATVKDVGPYLQLQVRERCILGHLQPLILFYEKENLRRTTDNPETACTSHIGSGYLDSKETWPSSAEDIQRAIYEQERELEGDWRRGHERSSNTQEAKRAGPGRSSPSRHSSDGSHKRTSAARSPSAEQRYRTVRSSSDNSRARQFSVLEDRRLDEDEDGAEEVGAATTPPSPRSPVLPSSYALRPPSMELGGGMLSYKRFDVGAGYLERRRKKHKGGSHRTGRPF